MKRKILFAVAFGALAVLTACGSKSETAENTTGQSEKTEQTETVEETPVVKQSEEQVISTLQDMYYNTEIWNYDFLTPEFREVLKASDKKAKEIGDEMGCFEFDIFTCSQDPDKHYSEIRNVKLNNDGTASAEVGSFGSKGYITVTVKLIDGEYFIDDIEDASFGSIKAEAKKYCNL